MARLCRWFGVPRSTVYYRGAAAGRQGRAIGAALVETVRQIIEANPAYGLRRITALARRELQAAVNRKRIHRILKVNGWQVRQRAQGRRPRVTGWVSRAGRPSERWAIDTTHLCCGRDGWCPSRRSSTAVIGRIVGWRLSRSGIAGVAAAALEDALRDRGISLAARP